ncbi:ABC transporter permease [Pseudonocardia xishanensis]|uniref:ABC transporter permease n=1 Tax=Pseudonocardia xishanensis TaxID=630995 RepID=A0ABP8RUF8_9PSEU
MTTHTQPAATSVGADSAPPGQSTRTALMRSRRRHRRTVLALRVGVAVVFLGMWELVSGRPRTEWALIDQLYVSKPSDIWASLVDSIADGTLLPNIVATTMETVLGFLLGAAIGLVLGFLLGISPLWSAVLRPYIVAMNSVPRLALVPLFVLWFGLGMSSKVVFVAMIVFFLVFYNTFAGVHDVDRELVDVLRVMGSSPVQLHTTVTLPSAMTWIISGLSISVPYALVAAVTAEIVASNEGVGYLLNLAAGQFDTAGVFAAILVLVVMGLILTGLVTLLERYLLRWKTDRLRSRSGF